MELADWLRRQGVGRGALAGLAVAGGLAAVTSHNNAWTGTARQLLRADRQARPRWAVWSQATATACLASEVRLGACWDVAAVHRLMYGGWRADPAYAWARLHDLPPPDAHDGPPDLFQLTSPAGGHADGPVGPDGLLRPSWVAGGWAESPARLARWAALAASAAQLQQARVGERSLSDRALRTAWSESAAELLCAELAADGLPMSRQAAERILAGIIGPRADAARSRAARDAAVLAHAPEGVTADLRSPAQVLSLLRKLGLDVPDTRASRLRELRHAHPLVDALLEWRKAERIATTYGYAWLDANLGSDGRLRGAWTASDGAAGRMTASAGLHNMPAVLRQAVIAEPGHVFVRADLGQIEPRVLAAVSGDKALAAATEAADLYAPVAAQLGVERAVAKVAVLGAMYGQTTGHGLVMLRRLRAAYPVAMAYLDAADKAAQAGHDLRTYGGRLVPMSASPADTPARRSARGRYGRNALVQGAAAEFFKMWAVTVRARASDLDARIVLCLHDELLVHVPAEHGAAVAQLLDECLAETAARWAPSAGVRFIADIRVITAWSDAK